MENLIELVDGFYWPKTGGKSCREITIIRRGTPESISKYCKNFNIVITAGGNVGYYAKIYAKIFKKVYTFEPDTINFQCLTLNVTEKNVIKTHGALGNNNEKIGLSTHCDDCGAWRVTGSGDIQTYKIDDLNLQELNLIALDVEGFEVEVLKGAINSINKFRPIISAEIDHINCSDFLVGIGYKKIDEINGDYVFKYNE